MIIDLFAGPGGWDVAAQALGLQPVGIEFDKAACLTREAAGLTTLLADVSRPPLRDDLDITGLIASPPCQTFSMAGKGNGRKALDQVLQGVKRVATGEPIPYDEYDDTRTGLVLEPLAWALRHEPEWLAWEQVPTVLPVWEACAEVLRADGYSVAVGVLHAEQYGVPQTRKRAVLIASRVREVALPAPTHTKYRKGKPRQDGGLLPWVSMAEALGWDDAVVRSNYGTGGDPSNRGERRSDEPAASVTSKVDRNVVLRSPQSIAGGPRAERDEAEPSVTVTSNFDRAKWQLRNNTSANAAVRSEDEPSPTLFFGGRMNGVYWQARNSGPGAAREPRPVEEPSYTIRAEGSGSHPSGVEWQMATAGATARYTAGQVPRDIDEPTATITGKGTAYWTPVDPDETWREGRPPFWRTDDQSHSAIRHVEEPAPTIKIGNTRGAQSGFVHDPADLVTEGRAGKSANGSVRVTVQEAGILQSFPADYPWQGTKTKQYQQVGNAIPPLLAHAVLRAALGVYPR